MECRIWYIWVTIQDISLLTSSWHPFLFFLSFYFSSSGLYQQWVGTGKELNWLGCMYMGWNRMEWGMLNIEYWACGLLEASSLARHCDVTMNDLI